MKTLKRENLKEFIKKNSKDDEITALFIKKNGEKRKIKFKTGAFNLKGSVNKVERKDRPYVTVYDTNKNEYRTLNVDTTKCIKYKNNIYRIK